MSISLGIATGSAGVGSALLTRHTNGAQDTEYRYMSADQANTDTGDLVRSSISLMTTQVPSKPTTPDAVAVAYRTQEQRTVITSALARSRHRVHLVPETDATLAYLRHTGEVARYTTVAIVDIGASGTTVSVVDQVDGTVLHSARTTAVSGDVVDELLYDHVRASLRPPAHRHLDEERLRARCRGIKEQLGVDSTSVVDAEHATGRPVEITSSTFADIIAPVVHDLTVVVQDAATNSPRTPEAIALVGGGACIPAVGTTMADSFDARIISVSEPDTATARGAALLASTPAVKAYAVVGASESTGRSSAAKASGALIGALVVGGLVLGYGVRALAPSEDPDVSPASTDFARTTAEQISQTEDATRIPSHDPIPDTAESNIIVTTTVIPNLPHSRAADPLPSSEDYVPPTTTEDPVTTLTTTTTTPPETTPPETSTTPTTPGTDPTQPGWPTIQWPDIPTFWPQPPGQSPNSSPTQEPGPQGFVPQENEPTTSEPSLEQEPQRQQEPAVTTTTPPPPG